MAAASQPLLPLLLLSSVGAVAIAIASRRRALRGYNFMARVTSTYDTRKRNCPNQFGAKKLADQSCEVGGAEKGGRLKGGPT